ncbi:MAG: hypothetical protein KGH59_03770 [Candidatus Micrarchaeota archaeon]|nr:hypothetical protein [Candidatus Micrarchaeota archaeon]MDE1847167.1 hypothetical protein [Candidatus Micrarchaeota archaeon]
MDRYKSHSSRNNSTGFNATTRDGNEVYIRPLSEEDYMPVNGRKAMCKSPISIMKASISGRKFERHLNPDGSIGGFVEKSTKIPASVYLGADCAVIQNAQVGEDCRIINTSAIGGKAKLGNKVTVDESDIGFDSVVGDWAEIVNSTLRYETQVGPGAKLYNVMTKGDCTISGGISLKNAKLSRMDDEPKSRDGKEPMPNSRTYLFQ